MNFILWIILGLAAGWLASVIMKTNASQSTVMDVILGVVGSLVGGFAMSFVGAPGATGFNLYSLFVATLGAVLLIWVGRLLSRSA